GVSPLPHPAALPFCPSAAPYLCYSHAELREEAAMTQTTGRIFDAIARLVTDAAGMAEGARREVETIIRAQMERMLRSMDVVSREEFDAVRDMAAAARDENERLAARIAELEARLARDEQDAAERE